jgi:hypothetical protein
MSPSGRPAKDSHQGKTLGMGDQAPLAADTSWPVLETVTRSCPPRHTEKGDPVSREWPGTRPSR